MTKLGIAINLERCVGCNTCANACKMQNNIPMNMLYIRVETDGVDTADGAQGTYPDLSRTYIPVACQHCENPACLKVCPVGATYKDDMGRVEIHYDKCIGCRICMAACPYNARVFNWSEPERDPNWNYGDKDVPVRPKGVAEKCTLCKERTDRGDIPMCVRVCPGRAACTATWTIPSPRSRRSCARTMPISCSRSSAPARSSVTTTRKGAQMETKRISRPVMVVLAVIAAAGAAAWIYQTMFGLGVTGMNNGTSWGLYIAAFMFFVGLSAGGLIVASSASIFHVTEFKKVALPAVCVSTVCICCAGLLVILDLGGVARIFNLIISPNFISPLFWDICVISCYLVINLVYLYFMTSKRADKSKIAIVSRFALPIAILVHTVTAWIFGLQIAREGWHSAIMGPLFVASTMDSGLALLLIALAWMNRRGIWETSKKLMGMLAGLLATCIAVDGYMVGCELLTTGYPGSEGGWHVLSQMFFGATAPYFWIEIIVGVLIPFTILVFAKNRQKTGLIVFSSACVVVGVFCKRVWLLFSSFITPNTFGGPGLIDGTSAATSGMDVWAATSWYAPSWVEYAVLLGVIALGALAFLILVERFIMKAKPTDLIDADAAAHGVADAKASSPSC